MLVGLSEELPKQDVFFTGAVAKIVDTLRNLLNNDATRLAQHTLVDERSVDDYLLREWSWNSSKYGTQRGLRDIVDTLVKVRHGKIIPSNSPRIRTFVLTPNIGNDLNRYRVEKSSQ